MRNIERKITTQTIRPDRDFEENSGERIVETAGYIPPNIQIKNMIDAGVRLEEYRRELYDIGKDEKLNDQNMQVDITRYGTADMVEADIELNKITERLEENHEKLQEEAKQRIEREKKKRSDEEELRINQEVDRRLRESKE